MEKNKNIGKCVDITPTQIKSAGKRANAICAIIAILGAITLAICITIFIFKR